MDLKDGHVYVAENGKKIRVHLQKFDTTGRLLPEGAERVFVGWFDRSDGACFFEPNGRSHPSRKSAITTSLVREDEAEK